MTIRCGLSGAEPTGERVAISGLSTGARDQLYLALRLASSKTMRCAPSHPPFIGDDLFATFDEDRTAHGLAALAAIGDRFQPMHSHAAPARGADRTSQRRCPSRGVMNRRSCPQLRELIKESVSSRVPERLTFGRSRFVEQASWKESSRSGSRLLSFGPTARTAGWLSRARMRRS